MLNEIRDRVQHIRTQTIDNTVMRELGHFVNGIATFEGGCSEVARLSAHLEVAIPILSVNRKTRLFAEGLLEVQARFQHEFCPNGC